jgi:hypothetical protein
VSERKAWGSTSPSQLSTFSDCARKWWRVSVNGERPPSTAAAERGSRIHEELERYLIDGAPLASGTARAIAQHLPFGGSVSAAAVEVAFTWAPPGWPVPIRGRVDLVELARGGEVVGITDHKTTSSLDYAKTERDLARDAQALLYSGAAYAGALDGVPAADEGEPLRFRLVYGTTRAPYTAREVSAYLSAGAVSTGLERLAEKAHAQASTATAPAWADVAPSYGSCDKYGGCPFLDDCRAAARPLPVYEGAKVSSADDWFASLAPASAAPSSSTPAPATPAPTDEQASPAPALLAVAPVVEEAPAAPPLGVYAINPPDGLPDGVEPPKEESKRPARVRVGGELRGVSSLKAGELKEVLAKEVSELSPSLRAAYEERAQAQGLKVTKAGLLERRELVASLKEGRVLPSDEVEGEGAFNLFSAPVEVKAAAPVEVVAPAPVDVVAPVEVVAPAPVDVVAPVEVERLAPAPVEARRPVSTPAPSLARVLLIDAHASGAVEGEAALAPLIDELSRAHGSPLALMDYARGWTLLGFEIERRGWADVFGGASVVRFDSASPVYRHASFSLLRQASLVVRGSR